MQLLNAAGIEPYTDGFRPADIHNEKGYYESGKVLTLPKDNSWLHEATGKSLKVISPLLRYLPEGFQYRIVFMERSLEEIVLSQQRMLEGMGKKGAGIAPEKMAVIYAKDLENLRAWMEKQPRFNSLRISYNELLARPQDILPNLLQFIGSTSTPEELMKVLDPSLYRSRSVR
ncbi:MAG: hypothetical protein RL213_856 [Bacteroidota bacterium]